MWTGQVIPLHSWLTNPVKLFSLLLFLWSFSVVIVLIFTTLNSDLKRFFLACQGLFLLFSEQQIADGFFYRDVLDRGDATMVRLGSLGGQLALVLAIAAVSTFVLTVAGTRALGKVCGLAIPTGFMLLVTLTIRACMESGGPLGITALMAPNWEVMTQPGVWMEAVAQVVFRYCFNVTLVHDLSSKIPISDPNLCPTFKVVFSLQLGLGALTAFASYNKFQHNLIRDCCVLVAAHIVWIVLSCLLSLALLGVAHSRQAINLDCLTSSPAECDTAIVSVTGKDIWLVTMTMIETSLASVSFGWLWAGLFLLLLVITGITSLFGFLEVVTNATLLSSPTLLSSSGDHQQSRGVPTIPASLQAPPRLHRPHRSLPH